MLGHWQVGPIIVAMGAGHVTLSIATKNHSGNMQMTLFTQWMCGNG
jgi:hypothetical protein